jgi:anti-anti-sigma factor
MTSHGGSESSALEPTVGVHWPKPDVAVVVLGGEHDLGTAPAVAQAAEEALASASQLIVDLSPAEFVDSTIINVLVQLRREAAATDRRFNVLLADSPMIERTLEICGVVEALNCVTTLEAALDDPSQTIPLAQPSVGSVQTAPA